MKTSSSKKSWIVHPSNILEETKKIASVIKYLTEDAPANKIMSKAQLATTLKMFPQGISIVSRLERNITVEQIRHFVKTFGVNPGYVFLNEPEMFIKDRSNKLIPISNMKYVTEEQLVEALARVIEKKINPLKERIKELEESAGKQVQEAKQKPSKSALDNLLED